MTIIATIGEYIDDAAGVAGSVAGLVLAVVVASEKIARLIPTNFKNKTLERIAKCFYMFFAILGAKVPDVAKVENGKIITNIEAVAQETIDKQPESSDAEPKKP